MTTSDSRTLRLRLSLLLFLTALLGASTAGAQVVLDDGDFSGWVLETSFAGGAFVRQTSGGNPGAHLELSAPGALSSVVVRDGATTYDPSSQGALTSIDFEADVLGASGDVLSFAAAGIGFVLIQDGDLYIAPVTFDVATWSPVARLGLVPSDFTNTLDPGTSPDFSASGGVIQFAVVYGAATTPGPAVLLDNLRVTVATAAPPAVPGLLPGGVSLLIAGLVATGVRAHRRRKMA